MSTLRFLSPALINNDGAPFGCISIWREGETGNHERKYTVGEWLSMPENQGGAWLFEGGWGFPPGPLYILWNEDEKAWHNAGYFADILHQRAA